MNNDAQSMIVGVFVGMALLALLTPRRIKNTIGIDLRRVELLREPEWYERN